MTAPIIIWLRRDLRLADHPALHGALAQQRPVLFLFIQGETAARPLGGASRWWLHHSLTALERDIRALGGHLVIRCGERLHHLQDIARQTGSRDIYCLRHWTPDEQASESHLTHALADQGIRLTTHAGDLLFEPGQVRTGSGSLFQVFTPFWRAAMALPAPARPLPAPAALPPMDHRPACGHVDDLNLLPRLPWWRGMADHWTPGEQGAIGRLTCFLDGPIQDYADHRDRPDLDGTSSLSPHLAWGEISPRQIWAALMARQPDQGRDCFGRELGWREFSHHLLTAHPRMVDHPLRPEFAAFPWRDNAEDLTAWSKGLTGYPIIDAGLRQLWHTGWMHNRVRMIVGSFLVKDLRLPWQRGEEWFWDCLVDASPAINPVSWQWVSGCGADAAPYFRVFNPLLQAQKFDPNGDYVRRWVPELARLPAKYIHSPDTAPPLELAAAKVRLGITYPAPMVDHAKARLAALAAFEGLKTAGGSPSGQMAVDTRQGSR